MAKRYECEQCFGTGRAGMLGLNVSDNMWRSDTKCPICKGKGFLGKPSWRRRFYEWLSAPEKMVKNLYC